MILFQIVYSVQDQPKQSTNPSNQLKYQFEQLCRGFGRQPCTCYHPDHPDVTIFELSSDNITANASRINAFGLMVSANDQCI